MTNPSEAVELLPWTDADLDKAAFKRWEGGSNKHANLRQAFRFGAHWARADHPPQAEGGDDQVEHLARTLDKSPDEIRRALENLKARGLIRASAPQAEGEAVAWQIQGHDGRWHDFHPENEAQKKAAMSPDSPWRCRALYAHPAPQQGVEAVHDLPLLLRQTRYVLRSLHAQHPDCGYGKMALGCEVAADRLAALRPSPDSGGRTDG